MFLNLYNFFKEKFKDYDQKILEKLTKITFEKCNVKKRYLVELNFVSDYQIKKLNKKYRQINKITDVLSFSFLESSDKKEIKVKNIKAQPCLLGEIDIAVKQACLQAKKYQHSINCEINFLYVHGLLHLLGYDHNQKKKNIVMQKKQKEILREININYESWYC